MRGKTHSPRIAVAVVLALSVALAGSATAAAKGKPQPGPSGTATVSVSPNPVAAGARYTIYGAGFAAGSQLNVKLITSTTTGFLFVWPGADGTFSVQHTTSMSGSVRVEVWKAAARKSTLLATTSFMVL